MAKTIGYVRVSTAKQNPQRQIDNIKAQYPDATIVIDKFTGTKMSRPAWDKVYKTVKAGDTIVFDEVSRMSRNAEDGFQVYQELYSRNVNLIFIKESTLNTENFRKTAQLAMTGTDVDLILDGINKYLMVLAENQIKSAFATAQHEVDFLHKRTAEGVRTAQIAGKQVGRAEGAVVTTKKSIAAKEQIRKYSKDFSGSLDDADVLKLIGISRNSYYKYKREMRAEAIA